VALRRKVSTGTPFRFAEDDLVAARDAGILSDAACLALVDFLRSREEEGEVESGEAGIPQPATIRFDLTHVLWYAGALIVILAMGVFTTEAFNRLGGAALTTTAVLYAVGFLILCHYLWHVSDLRTPGGLAAALAVAMVPMAIYGIQDMLGLWPDADGEPGQYRNFFPYVNSSWVYMELGTIATAVVVLSLYPFPFITFVAAIALWFLSMDVAGWFGHDRALDFALRSDVSLWFGFALVIVAWIIDLKWRSRGNFAFWLHLAGAAAFWGGLTSRQSSNEWLGFTYCLVNIGLVLFSVLVDRRIYAVFGGLGIAIYLGHLAYDVFDDALWFSFALSGIGLLIIGLGILYQRNRQSIERFVDGWIPETLRIEREPRQSPPRL
jgi:hypothetical protein